MYLSAQHLGSNAVTIHFHDKMSTPAGANGSSPSTRRKMGDAAIAHLSQTPWCAALIDSPEWTPTRTASRVPKPTTEDSFFAETLGTSRTIRSCLTLRPVKEEEDGDMVFKEVRTIMELGDGLNGYPRMAHGGFVATMLDEVMGVLLTLNIEAKNQRRLEVGRMGPDEGMNCFTACMFLEMSLGAVANGAQDLNTSYKKPVPTPGVVLCTAKFDRRERNKIYIRTTIEDGQGTVYTVGEGMFIEVKTKI